MALVRHSKYPSSDRAPAARPSSSTFLRDRRSDKALLIGLEYRLERNEDVSSITGVHDDVRKFKKHLISHEGYLPENITVLLDDGIGDITGGAVTDADLHR